MLALDLALARWPKFVTRLAKGAQRYRKAATGRRLGYLVTQLAGAAAAGPFEPLVGVSRAATPLDPSGGKTGEYDARWRLRVNIDVDELLTHRITG